MPPLAGRYIGFIFFLPEVFGQTLPRDNHELLLIMMFAEEQIHSTGVTLLVHEFCSSEGSRHRLKQQVLKDGLRLVASEIIGQPLIFSNIHESNRGEVVYSIS